MKTGRIIFVLILIALVSVCFVVTLFISSEYIIHKRNNFVRRFADQVQKDHEIDLKLKGYYFAGQAGDSLYLGNYDGPLYLASVDKKLKNLKLNTLTINRIDLPFRSVEIRVIEPHFFLTDGTIPAVFRGELNSFQAQFAITPKDRFSHVVAAGPDAIAYRTHSAKGESILGSTKLDGSHYKNEKLLQKQIDGNFDVDGTLHFDAVLNNIVYIYRYRNQYIVAQPDLSLVTRGNTIDTVSKAQIKVEYVKSQNSRTMAAPPVSVNQTAAAYNGLLFVHSNLISKYEDIKIWKQASVIDVYSYNDHQYIASLYIYNIDNLKLRSLYASGKNLYAIIGQKLVSYKLTGNITKHYTVKER